MSTPSLKFLLDENVRVELARFLKTEGLDVMFAPRSVVDFFLASRSQREGRVLVTNDIDFCEYSGDEIFAVVWLRIPQNNPSGLVSSFEKFLRQVKNFKGRLFVLEPHKWLDFPLSKKLKIELKPK